MRKLMVCLEACYEGTMWVSTTASAREAWATCDRGDRLLWVCEKLGIDRRRIVLAACDCARTALKFVPAGEDWPRKAIEAGEGWARGTTPIEEVRAAARAARNAANNAARNAVWAASNAAWAAWEASTASNAARAARNAASNAARNAARAAWEASTASNAVWAASNAARAASAAECADLVRKRIPFALVLKAARKKLKEAK